MVNLHPYIADVQEGRLVYTQQCVKESLRKYAPINLFPRLVEGEDVLPSGHKVGRRCRLTSAA